MKIQPFSKRLCDIVMSSILICILSPVIVFVSILICFLDGTPILYRQIRVGLAGLDFTMFKFRTMKICKDEKKNDFSARKNDPRVTSLGRILRKFGLDEIPQLYNVLRGDMSFVGPRPAVRQELNIRQLQSLEFQNRHTIRPGITGLAQAMGRNSINWDQKLKYDSEYLDNLKYGWFRLDARIVLLTMRNLILQKGVYED